jgi:putative PIN family toxin of toxin-antitoxin system
MRYVFDTNVIVAALRSPKGASAELLRRVRHDNIVMLASVPLFAEYEAVATRLEHLQAAGTTPAKVENVLDVLALFAERIEIHYLWRPRLRDPDDDMVLEVAVNGRAEAIVTFNGADFGGIPGQFGIAVVTPGELLRRL